MTSSMIPATITKVALAAVLVTATALGGEPAVPLSAKAGQSPDPAAGNLLTPAYVQAVGRMAYLWGWPLVNMTNRAAAAARLPAPGLIGGVLPLGYNGLAMLTDYVNASERGIACPNQDVVYGSGFFDLGQQPAVCQIPDFGERFWVFGFYDMRTDEFSRIGKQYGTKPGFYLLVGPNWSGATPAGITGVVRSTTRRAFLLPRIFMDDTADDRQAIQPVLGAIDCYPVSQFDGTVKHRDWHQLPHYPVQVKPGTDERPFVNPDTYFDELPAVLSELPPQPGEEALYAWIGSVLRSAAANPTVNDTLVQAARAAEAELITPLMQWRYNGHPAGNGWNTPLDNGQWGTDYLNRTASGKSNILDNRPEETAYLYTDGDSQGQPLQGANGYAIRFAPGKLPPGQGFWSLTLYDSQHFFNTNPLNHYSLGTKNKGLKYAADGSLTLYAGAQSPGAALESNWLPAPAGPFSLYLRIYWPDEAVRDGRWLPPVVSPLP
ncbi:DUF1254 domain-containing protein [uncultured Thiodictyon sp.]|uniref:DUF1254 domain-containing protein n=1 Tax=uncultured Thiodictyon sp. TaxID=1846217 RepID=UPI0025ED0389|nr:DUF1254 domain-containing protein [uncultured Thiodictyon sp.]